MTGTSSARFDWYELTVDGVDDGRVATAIALALGARISRGKGRNGYASCEVVERDEVVLAQVYGRSSRAGEVHVVTSSESCDEVVPLVRRLYPVHRVSRADSAVDFAADFAVLDARAMDLAASRSVSHRLIVDSDGGATRYLGAPSSELRVRVYRKTEQLRALHPERAHEIPDGIVRVELQARPGKRAVKEQAATLDAGEFWGLGRWTKELAGGLLDFDAPRVPTHFRRPTDWARAVHFLGVQYRPMVEARAALVGVDQARAEVLAALGLGE